MSWVTWVEKGMSKLWSRKDRRWASRSVKDEVEGIIGIEVDIGEGRSGVSDLCENRDIGVDIDVVIERALKSGIIGDELYVREGGDNGTGVCKGEVGICESVEEINGDKGAVSSAKVEVEFKGVGILILEGMRGTVKVGTSDVEFSKISMRWRKDEILLHLVPLLKWALRFL